MSGKVYAFLAVGRGLTGQGDAAKYVRIGWSKHDTWKKSHRGPSTPEEVLLEVDVPDAKQSMSLLIEILRGNQRYGPEQHILGGWQEEMLYEKPAFGNYWCETVYGTDDLREIFRNIGLDLTPEPGAVAAKAPTTGSV